MVDLGCFLLLLMILAKWFEFRQNSQSAGKGKQIRHNKIMFVAISEGYVEMAIFHSPPPIHPTYPLRNFRKNTKIAKQVNPALT